MIDFRVLLDVATTDFRVTRDVDPLASGASCDDDDLVVRRDSVISSGCDAALTDTRREGVALAAFSSVMLSGSAGALVGLTTERVLTGTSTAGTLGVTSELDAEERRVVRDVSIGVVGASVVSFFEDLRVRFGNSRITGDAAETDVLRVRREGVDGKGGDDSAAKTGMSSSDFVGSSLFDFSGMGDNCVTDKAALFPRRPGVRVNGEAGAEIWETTTSSSESLFLVLLPGVDLGGSMSVSLNDAFDLLLVDPSVVTGEG
jgi:hypothetical protein